MTTARVLIAGGGLGGIETAVELKRRLGDRVAVTVVSPQQRFLFRPDTVFIPFAERVPGLGFDLEPALARGDIEYRRARVVAIDPRRRALELDGGSGRTRLKADFVVLATGARTEPSLIPGFEDRVISVWTAEGMERLGNGLRAAVERAKAGAHPSVLFLVPPGVYWPAPLYELAFLAHDWLRRREVRSSVRVSFRTAESAYLNYLGPRMDPVMDRGFADRGIDGERSWRLARIEGEDAVSEAGERISAELMVAFPPYRGTADFSGLPTDEKGFVLTEPDGSLRVRGWERLYVVGDAGDFPVKQGELAMLQAVAAADSISAELLGIPRKKPFRADSQLMLDRGDDGLFVLAPLETTGHPDDPVRIRPEAAHLYRVGESPVWRLVKRGLRAGINSQLRRGRPLHAGPAGLAMKVGTAILSRLFAD
jgi:sulfide:quinone oxidoreductase